MPRPLRSGHRNSDGESIVSDYLRGHGLLVHRFSKTEMRQSQTPDFRVMVGDRLAFYCEVKTSHYDDWLDRQLDEAPPGTLAGGLRPDPTYNRVSNYIHRAVGQLDAVNAACEFPNVVAIVNNDLKAGLADLLSVLTGNAYTDGAAIRMFESSSGG